jgi:phosphoribosylformylglycinamidine (FGAM) synthase-like enzyme
MKKDSPLRAAAILCLLFIAACGAKQQAETGQKAVNKTDEASAIQALQTVFRAETQYSLTHAGEYGMFDDLVKENFLERRFSGRSPELAGYVLTVRLRPQSGGEAAAFAVNADPKQAEGAPAAAARHLYIDSSSNVVRAAANRPATADDPPLEQ